MHVGFHSLRQARRIEHPISVCSQGWYVRQSSCARQVIHRADSVPVSDTHPISLNRLNIIHLHTTSVTCEPSPQKQSLASLPVTSPLLSDELPPVADSPYNNRTSIRFFCPSIGGLYPAVLSSSFRTDFCRHSDSSRLILTRDNTEISLRTEKMVLPNLNRPSASPFRQRRVSRKCCSYQAPRLELRASRRSPLSTETPRWFALEHVGTTPPLPQSTA